MRISTTNAKFKEPTLYVNLPDGEYNGELVGAGRLLKDKYLQLDIAVTDGDYAGSLASGVFLTLGLTGEGNSDYYMCQTLDALSGVPAMTHFNKAKEDKAKGEEYIDIKFLDQDENGVLSLNDEAIGRKVRLVVSTYFKEKDYKTACRQAQANNYDDPDRDEVDDYGKKRFYSSNVNIRPFEPKEPVITAEPKPAPVQKTVVGLPPKYQQGVGI